MGSTQRTWGFFRRMLFLLSFFLGLFLTLSSGCQNIGNECWSSTNGAAAGGCCDGTQCGPWSPNNEPWDGSSAWYCLSMPRIASGGTCNYDTKNGLCVEGTYCCNGVCSSSCSAPTTTTTTTTTTSTSTTSTTTQECIADGDPCWENMGLVNQGICCSTGQKCDVQNPMMTTNC